MRADETYVHGRSPETARALLDAADRAGLPAHVVRAWESGFIVPDAVWAEAEAALTAPDPEAVF